MSVADQGLVLAPFRAVRPHVGPPDAGRSDACRSDRGRADVETAEALGRRLCPPYDVIDAAQRAALLAADPDNAVAIVLPSTEPGPPSPDGQASGNAYAEAANRLQDWIDTARWQVDAQPALYVYEMAPPGAPATRGLLGAVALRDPAAGVILPHENTMAGPVADRLALMTATQANLEPIYLVYDGGGPASQIVAAVDTEPPLALAITPDGTRHRLWAITDASRLAEITADLAPRHALIADGHHRYATYLTLQKAQEAEHGPGPWDRGLTLLVDTSAYGPQVHPIHRVLPGLDLAEALAAIGESADVTDLGTDAVDAALATDGPFVVVLTDGERTVLVRDRRGALAERAVSSAQAGEPAALAHLDVTIFHRVLVEQLWDRPDTEEAVGYAHSIGEALAAARRSHGVAALLRATPVAAVAAVAAAGARMPRKSTLFTPKPASGLVLRRFVDER